MVPQGHIGTLKLVREECRQAAADGAQRETAAATVEERRRWDPPSKARKKRADTRLEENVTGAPEKVT